MHYLISLFLLFLCSLKFYAIPYGLAVRIPGFHPGGPGSTPGMGTHFLSVQTFQVLFLGFYQALLGRVVRKPVNVNRGLKVNQSINFSCIKLFPTAYVLCSLNLVKLKIEGQTV